MFFLNIKCWSHIKYDFKLSSLFTEERYIFGHIIIHPYFDTSRNSFISSDISLLIPATFLPLSVFISLQYIQFSPPVFRLNSASIRFTCIKSPLAPPGLNTCVGLFIPELLLKNTNFSSTTVITCSVLRNLLFGFLNSGHMQSKCSQTTVLKEHCEMSLVPECEHSQWQPILQSLEGLCHNFKATSSGVSLCSLVRS